MTVEKPSTAELADKVTHARKHLMEARQHMIDVRSELAALVEQMNTLPQMADIDMVIADLRNDSFYLRHCIYLLGGAVTD